MNIHFCVESKHRLFEVEQAHFHFRMRIPSLLPSHYLHERNGPE